jgi:hypothetical protein
MATIRALDANGDFTFGNNKGNYISGAMALQQNIVTRLREYAGDCFFDKSSGIDYDYLLATKNSQNDLRNAVRLIILQTEDVREIVELYINVDNRNMVIKATVSSIYGTFDTTLNV